MPYADLSDPQPLNLYGYVRSNPLSRADSDAHCCEATADFGERLMVSPIPFLRVFGTATVVVAGVMQENANATKPPSVPVEKTPSGKRVRGFHERRQGQGQGCECCGE